ncbi:hypothetical protein ANN_01768 [Periplaneta americana]|uniref:WIF domain-containing protein n=1 Tax=Periplaneta americana TaxID=6978 RepID=A0ABQ8TWW1_PERAM|nr:hypothetical protein ANN_01768 [Periplaneta americana]
MVGLCEGGNEPPGSLKASKVRFPCTGLQSAEIEVLLQLNVSTYNPLHNETSLNFRRNKICLKVNCPKTSLNFTSDTKKAPLLRQLDQEILE